MFIVLKWYSNRGLLVPKATTQSTKLPPMLWDRNLKKMYLLGRNLIQVIYFETVGPYSNHGFFESWPGFEPSTLDLFPLPFLPDLLLPVLSCLSFPHRLAFMTGGCLPGGLNY